MDETNANVVDATQEGVVDSQSEQAETTVESVNAEGAEVTTGKQEETKPVQSAEENARFAEVRRKAEAEAKTKARDELIAEMYGESHGIKTYAEYQAAIERQKQEEHDQAIRDEYEAKGLPEDVVNELVEWKKSREQSKAEQETKQQQEKQQQDMMDFLKEFPDVKPEDIPVEVWQANANGVPLSYAYAKHALSQARKAEEVAKANAENAKSSTGSVSTNGNTETEFISRETFEAKKGDRGWIVKNLSKINQSRTKWQGLFL